MILILGRKFKRFFYAQGATGFPLTDGKYIIGLIMSMNYERARSAAKRERSILSK
jgi:hypothetical protein